MSGRVVLDPTLRAIDDPATGAIFVTPGHCLDCKHWVPFGYSINSYENRATTPAKPGEPDHRFLQKWETKNELGICRKVDGHQNAAGDEGTEYEPRNVLACVEDLSDHAFLRTGPQFGCVLWEGKATP